MTAYVISEVEILNEQDANKYRPIAKESITRFGGRYLVRDGTPEALEGDFSATKRLVIVEFSSVERIHEWYSSPLYAQALAAANGALSRRLVLVDGVVP